MTDEEVLAIVAKQWESQWDHERVTLAVEENSPRRIRVRVSRMYGPPGLTFAILMALSEAFGTKQIDANDTFSDSGCETCDCGSSYGFTLDIRPEEKK